MEEIIKHLHPKVQNMITQSAASIGCPAEFNFAAFLATASTIIGGSHMLQVKKGYTVNGNLYITVIADAGTKKTPSIDMMLKPIKGYQKQLFEDFKIQINRKDDLDNETKLQQLITTDSTTESLNEILLSNPHGVLIHKDELPGLFKSFNQYRNGSGADMEFYLSGWTGSETIVTRKSLPMPIFIERPIITILGGIQPAIVPTIPNFKENGILERFLFIYPKLKSCKYSTLEIDDKVVEEYNEVCLKLLKKYHSISLNENPRIIKFSMQAQEMWDEWAIRHSEEMRSEAVPNYLVSYWSKLESYAARLALLLELCQEKYLTEDCIEVTSNRLKISTSLIEFFKENARKVWRLFSEDPSHEKDLQKLKDLINRKKDRNGFITRREVLNTKILGVKRNDDVDGLFEDLEFDGFGKRTTRKNDKRRDTPGFIVKGSKTYNCS